MNRKWAGIWERSLGKVKGQFVTYFQYIIIEQENGTSNDLGDF